MPTIALIDGIKIQVFADHRPPHFHVVAAEEEVVVRISDLTVLQGRMRKASLRRALDWAEANRQEIEDAWNKLNP
jgi:hypothetical protein